MTSRNEHLSSPLFEMAACVGWIVEETRALVSVWSQNNIQNQLDIVALARDIQPHYFSLIYR